MFNVHILDGIGSTEALHIYLSNDLENIREGISGKIISGNEAWIVNELGLPLLPNEMETCTLKGRALLTGTGIFMRKIKESSMENG